jgi:hypothetical protein
MIKMKQMATVVVIGMLALFVRADSFSTNNPSGTAAHNFSIDFVTVGDAGNAGTTGFTNTSETFGGVAYNYRIGKTEISVGQFNAMEYSITGNATGLSSTLAAGSVNTVKALMYANWLNADCPTGGNGLLDGGVYNFTSWTTIAPWAEELQWDNGDGTKNIWRHKDAKYFLATEDELVKAAFYKGGSTDAGYWYYPTSSDTAPTAESASSGTNSANYANAVGSAVDVGSYPDTQSPYGALDMAGNLWEMAEVRYDSGNNQYIPGWMDGYIHGDTWLRGTIGFGVNTAASDLGFRIAAVVPEPISLGMLGFGVATILIRRRK